MFQLDGFPGTAGYVAQPITADGDHRALQDCVTVPRRFISRILSPKEIYNWTTEIAVTGSSLSSIPLACTEWTQAHGSGNARAAGAQTAHSRSCRCGTNFAFYCVFDPTEDSVRLLLSHNPTYVSYYKRGACCKTLLGAQVFLRSWQSLSWIRN
jgi:hypothetical protein